MQGGISEVVGDWSWIGSGRAYIRTMIWGRTDRQRACFADGGEEGQGEGGTWVAWGGIGGCGRQGRAGQGRAGQGRAGQGRAGQGRVGQGGTYRRIR
jgi:hypothetical protein